MEQPQTVTQGGAIGHAHKTVDGRTQGGRVYEPTGTLAGHTRLHGGDGGEVWGAVSERREYRSTVPEAERDGQ